MNTRPEDISLWNTFREGNEEALGILMQNHYQSLYGYAAKFSKDTEFIKDCIQDLFMELWDRRLFLGDTDSVKFYLLRSLRRKIHKEGMKRKWLDESRDLEFDFYSESFGQSSAEYMIIEKETINEYTQKINSLLSHLSKRQQEVIHLRFYEKLENEEIAQLMCISRQGVANLIYRTLKDLKDLWGKPQVLISIIIYILFFSYHIL